eukprot:scaffold10257_cov22-Tisochrysis_lutea.AAC.4
MLNSLWPCLQEKGERKSERGVGDELHKERKVEQQQEDRVSALPPGLLTPPERAMGPRELLARPTWSSTAAKCQPAASQTKGWPSSDAHTHYTASIHERSIKHRLQASIAYGVSYSKGHPAHTKHALASVNTPSPPGQPQLSRGTTSLAHLHAGR